MDICQLYELVKFWETTLTLSKPDDIVKVTISPIVKDDIRGMGEGDIYSYLKVYVEKENEYAESIHSYDYTHYIDDASKKWAEEVQIASLIEFLEDGIALNYFSSFWEEILQDIAWKPTH